MLGVAGRQIQTKLLEGALLKALAAHFRLSTADLNGGVVALHAGGFLADRAQVLVGPSGGLDHSLQFAGDGLRVGECLCLGGDGQIALLRRIGGLASQFLAACGASIVIGVQLVVLTIDGFQRGLDQASLATASVQRGGGLAGACACGGKLLGGLLQLGLGGIDHRLRRLHRTTLFLQQSVERVHLGLARFALGVQFKQASLGFRALGGAGVQVMAHASSQLLLTLDLVLALQTLAHRDLHLAVEFLLRTRG